MSGCVARGYDGEGLAIGLDGGFVPNPSAMSLIVKICGLSTEETVDAALAAGADMVGFNFFPRSPRYVTPTRAATLAQRARGKTEIVAVTVDMDDADIADIVASLRPDWLQLHGGETAERVTAVRQRFGKRVMKAVGIREARDLAGVEHYDGIADRLLLDAKPPKGAIMPGGNGAAFDWHLLRDIEPGLSFMLSGGLDAGNVGEALALTRAPGVDVSSGVETTPAKKDPDLIHTFIAAARRAEMLLELERVP